MALQRKRTSVPLYAIVSSGGSVILAAITLRAVVDITVLAEAVVARAGVVLLSIEGGCVLTVSVVRSCELMLSVK